MTDIELHPDFAPAPTTLFQRPDPGAIVAQATGIANAIAPLIRDQNLVKRIGQSEHVFLEGWTLAGTMLGVFPITVSSRALIDPEGIEVGYEATVEARTMAGAVVGRADAQCTRDENAKWRDAPSFQLRSMAITRASSKALRMPLGFVMKLAGYDTTPAEEMEAAAARGETVTGGKGVRPGWRDMAEQQRAHADLGELIDAHDLRSWVVEWCDSKSYVRPLAKGQFNQLKRAIEQELEDRATKTAGSGAPPAPGSAHDASVTGPGDTGVSSGHEPPNAEATTSPRPPTSPGGRGGRKSRSEVPAGESGGDAVGSPSDRDQPEGDGAEQAQADDAPGRWTR
jgi:hypothetical protein